MLFSLCTVTCEFASSCCSYCRPNGETLFWWIQPTKCALQYRQTNFPGVDSGGGVSTPIGSPEQESTVIFDRKPAPSLVQIPLPAEAEWHFSFMCSRLSSPSASKLRRGSAFAILYNISILFVCSRLWAVASLEMRRSVPLRMLLQSSLFELRLL